MVKNNILANLCMLALLVFSSCTNANAVLQSKNSNYTASKKIFEINKRSELIGYVIQGNKLYIGIWVDTDGYQGKSFIYEYNNGKLKDMKLSEEKADKFLESKIPFSNVLEDKEIEIKPNLSFKISGSTYALNFYDMFIIKDGKEKKITNNKSYAYLNSNYIYIDKENEKIYFYGRYKTDKEILWGMHIYDVNNDKFISFKPSEDGKVNGYDVEITYINPIRVPNTPYLMYIVNKEGKNGGESTMNIQTEVWIEEIPEWKTEIENQNKGN